MYGKLKKAIDNVENALDELKNTYDSREQSRDCNCAAGPLEAGEPPKDGTVILAIWRDEPEDVEVVFWEGESWWYAMGGHVGTGDPDKFALINEPRGEK